MFANRQQAAGRSFTILGAVLGQKLGEESTSALIAAAVSAADALVHSIAPSVSVKTVVPAGTEVGVATNADGKKVSLVTSAPLTLLGYSGMAVPLSVSIANPGTSLQQGQTVGRISLGNGQSTTVVAAATVAPVSFGWKLLHDY